MAICEHCATESPSGFRFCGACGAPLASGALDRDARKVVTLLFCDVADSTALGERLDPEALHDVLGRYFDAARAAIERHGGTVQKYAGDAVLAAFGIPRVHEDDALRAVRAAAEIRERLPAIAEAVRIPLRVRVGINTGVVLTDEGRNLALGDAVNVAARLEQAAAPGEILIGAATMELVRDAVEAEPLAPLVLRGKSDSVAAHRLLRLDPNAPGLARRLDVPLVNRARELRQLIDAWERTVADSGCRLVTVLGSAGVGKSRLVEELLVVIGGAARTLRGRCLPYGEGITFWPIVEALTPVGAAAEPILERLSSGGVAAPEELFWEVRRLLESLAAPQPVVLYLDDVQWAEPMLVALLGHLVELSRGRAILVLCTARPELLEEHPELVGGQPNATTIELEVLGEGECEQLLAQLGEELEAGARSHVIRTSEGNPLFLQEMAVLAREHGSLQVPPTIQALLAARLERLDPGERELLARSAVEGQVFHRSAVQALSSCDSEHEIESGLQALVRKDLIRPAPANVPGDAAYRFRHLLIRDAAYERLPKTIRAELHARYAGWLEGTAVEFAEVDEIAGWHLEQAVRHERDVRRPVDDALKTRAADHLHAAGLRAGERSDSAAARNLLDRAFAVAPAGDPLRARIGIALAERLIEIGDLARADELLTLCEHAPADPGGAALVRLEWMVLSDPSRGTRTIESRLPAMLEQLSRDRDERGQAKAHWLAFWARWAASQATLAAEQARLSAEHARRAGDLGLWSRALGWYVATLIYGPLDAAGMADELEAIEAQDPGLYLHACVELGRAEVERLQGRFDPARELARSALEHFRALGMHTMAATADQSAAAIELSAGDRAAAIAALQRSEGILAEFGESVMRSTTQAMLARALAGIGELTGAEAAVTLAERLSAPEDWLNFATTHGVRALLALASGEQTDAERWARSAVARAERTDFLGVQAETQAVLARVLSAGRDRDEARAAAERARELFQRKGDRPGGTAAERLLGEIAAARTRDHQ